MPVLGGCEVRRIGMRADPSASRGEVPAGFRVTDARQQARAIAFIAATFGLMAVLSLPGIRKDLPNLPFSVPIPAIEAVDDFLSGIFGWPTSTPIAPDAPEPTGRADTGGSPGSLAPAGEARSLPDAASGATQVPPGSGGGEQRHSRRALSHRVPGPDSGRFEGSSLAAGGPNPPAGHEGVSHHGKQATVHGAQDAPGGGGPSKAGGSKKGSPPGHGKGGGPGQDHGNPPGGNGPNGPGPGKGKGGQGPGGNGHANKGGGPGKKK